MKYCVAITLCLFVLDSTGQEEILPLATHKTHTIGTVAEIPFGDRQIQPGIGIQYKRWVKHNRAWRIHATHNKLVNNWLSASPRINGNTLYEQNTNSTIDLFYLGGGIEMQKQFYKRVYLFAAIDLRAGYGSGSYYTVERRTVFPPDSMEYSSVYRTTADLPVSRFVIDTAPFVGVKLLFKRLSFGTELSAISAGMTHIKIPDAYRSSYSLIDVNVGVIRQRFFINYRF